MEVRTSRVTRSSNVRLRLCAAWLAAQNDIPEAEVQVPSIEDASLPEELYSIPAAVDEDNIKPQIVPLHKLRKEGLRLECEWRGCCYVTEKYDAFQKHVSTHIPQLEITPGPNAQYKCLWDICYYQSADGIEMTRHVNFHAYHAMLMSVGVSAKYNLKLPPCNRSSEHRNKIPLQNNPYKCHWVGCDLTFTAIQDLFTHAHAHVQYEAHRQCSWAGCGSVGKKHVQHIRAHLQEKVIACPNCGTHFNNNAAFRDHMRRQNVPKSGGYRCGVCGREHASARLLSRHARQHVCMFACSYCDMTLHSRSALALHMRYRHLSERPGIKRFSCSLCEYRCIAKSDLRKHEATHNKKPKVKEDPDLESFFPKTPKEKKKFICHVCPEDAGKVFSRGTRLTTHLVKTHGARWPDGHCRFKYEKSEDGLYRLTTTRYESLEVSDQIMRGGAKKYTDRNLDVSINVSVRKKSAATKARPTLFEININEQPPEDAVDDPSAEDTANDDAKTKETRQRDQEMLHEEVDIKPDLMRQVEPNVIPEMDPNVAPDVKPNIEIIMCDVDEEGNVIRTEVMDQNEIVIHTYLKSPTTG